MQKFNNELKDFLANNHCTKVLAVANECMEQYTDDIIDYMTNCCVENDEEYKSHEDYLAKAILILNLIHELKGLA